MSADFEDVRNEGNVEEWSKSLCSVVRRRAAEKLISVKGKRKTKKILPWWNKAGNRAYGQLRKSLGKSHAIEYKRL